MRRALCQWCGVGLTRIVGIDVSTALKVLVEFGPQLQQFKTAKHFASWLGLCPGTKISGGKHLSGASKRLPNRVAQALTLAAQGLHRSPCALGAYYRRMATRARCWRVHSALTHTVNAIEAINDRFHAACEGIQSGQLPVLS